MCRSCALVFNMMRVFSVRFDPPNGRYEPIAASCHGFNKLRMGGVVTECFPEHLDVKGEITFLDKTPWPDPFHQFVLFDQLSGIFKKELECFKYFWGDRERLARAQQDLFRYI